VLTRNPSATLPRRGTSFQRATTTVHEIGATPLRDLLRQRAESEAYLERLKIGHDESDRKRHLNAVEKMLSGVEALWEQASVEERKQILKGFLRRVDLAGGDLRLEIRVPVLFGELAEVVTISL
jgi:hypothetical protein